MTKTMPLSEVKTHLSQLVANVARREDEVVITRNGRPAAVLVSADEYESWKETQEIKRDPELMREIREGIKGLAKGKSKIYRNLDELFGESSR